jgi:hypothetical protein
MKKRILVYFLLPYSGDERDGLHSGPYQGEPGGEAPCGDFCVVFTGGGRMKKSCLTSLKDKRRTS